MTFQGFIYIHILFFYIFKKKHFIHFRPKYNAATTTTSSANNGDATKRFANAKSISSQQYFGNEKTSEVIYY